MGYDTPYTLYGNIWDTTPIMWNIQWIPLYSYISSLSHCIPPHPSCLVKPLSRPVPSLRVAGDGQLGVEEPDLAEGKNWKRWTGGRFIWCIFYGGFMGQFTGISPTLGLSQESESHGSSYHPVDDPQKTPGISFQLLLLGRMNMLFISTNHSKCGVT